MFFFNSKYGSKLGYLSLSCFLWGGEVSAAPYNIVAGNATGSNAIAIGENSNSNGDYTISVGDNSKAINIGSVAVGYNSEATEKNSTAVGGNAKALGGQSIALGNHAKSEGYRSTAVGPHAKTNGNGTVAIGALSSANESYAVAIGNGATSGASAVAIGLNTNAHTSSVALGNGTKADGVFAVALGGGAEATKTGSIALGYGAEATHAGSIALGQGAKATGTSLKDKAYLEEKGAVGVNSQVVGELNIGKETLVKDKDTQETIAVIQQRRITGVAAGANDTDAVNVSQLRVVSDLVDAVGIRTGALEEADKLNVKYSKDSNYSQIELAGNTGTVLSNVADGEVSETSSQAVNGSQLYLAKQEVLAQANEKFNIVNNRVDELNERVNKFDKDAKAGIASAIAIASLPQPTEKGYSMLSLGTGAWGGETSLAIGASGVTQDKKLFNTQVNYVWKFASTTNSRSSWGGGASVGVQWK